VHARRGIARGASFTGTLFLVSRFSLVASSKGPNKIVSVVCAGAVIIASFLLAL